MTTTMTTTDKGLLDQLAERLADLAPERSAYYLSVKGLRVYHNQRSYGGGEHVSVGTGSYSRRGRGKHRFTNLDPDHLAKQVRRLLAERDKANAIATQWEAERLAQKARVEAAKAHVEAAIEAIPKEQGRTTLGACVREWEAHEVPAADEHERRYQFDLELDGLSEAQALAIVAIVRGELSDWKTQAILGIVRGEAWGRIGPKKGGQ